ncbi:putative nucleotidyltransferase [Gottschalkia purinilytica]|uniref:Putative nucleotidyltransferase n=1 Tax=Gottschalkia purinilytica TaxID=1503 RepID=A0A0L0WA23_GOTPU|nr:nucleotidyltransferase domain-containing protein [Gottschalkia purinilytica]KNF08311.1 putative nucleotidyltransferase [Gottschalkia purinilytica]
MKKVQKNFNEVNNILKENIGYLAEKYNIVLIYVFGSYAKGTNNHNSDLDIAILTKEKYDSFIKLEILGELIDIFKRDDIDLVILNKATSVMKHQVIKYGKLVYMKNENIKVEFESKVLSEYMDMEYFRRVQRTLIYK